LDSIRRLEAVVGQGQVLYDNGEVKLVKLRNGARTTSDR